MKTLPITLEEFGFVEREKFKGKTVKNRCGRDFLYYGLHYYLPQKFNDQELTPQGVENRGFFGFKLPSWFMGTMLQFVRMPKYLKQHSLGLFINTQKINSFKDFVSSILFSRISFSDAVSKVEEAINEGRVVGIDIGLKYGGLLDHVMFVYGYDVDAFYVCDTHQVPMLEYVKISEGNKYFMKLSKKIVEKRWTRFGRVWELKKI